MDSVSISLNKGNIWISEYDSNSWFRARNKIQIWSGHDRGVPFSDNHLSLHGLWGRKWVSDHTRPSYKFHTLRFD